MKNLITGAAAWRLAETAATCILDKYGVPFHDLLMTTTIKIELVMDDMPVALITVKDQETYDRYVILLNNLQFSCDVFGTGERCEIRLAV